MKKNDLRSAIKSELKALETESYLDLSLQVSKNLQSFFRKSPLLEVNSLVGVYSPIQNEPNWSLIFSKDSFSAVYPSYDSSHMVFKETGDFYIEGQPSLNRGKEVKPKLCLLPGLAFGVNGERLGRGGGFYDRYLAEHQVFSIGLCFEFQIKQISVEGHDQNVDVVITDQNIYTAKVM